jgi:hypothetical protein
VLLGVRFKPPLKKLVVLAIPVAVLVGLALLALLMVGLSAIRG